MSNGQNPVPKWLIVVGIVLLFFFAGLVLKFGYDHVLHPTNIHVPNS